MSDSTEQLEQRTQGVSPVQEHLTSNRPLLLLIAVVVLVTAAAVGYAALTGAEESDREGASEIGAAAEPSESPEEPVAEGDAEPPAAAVAPEDAAEAPVADAPPSIPQNRTRDADASTAAQDAPGQSAAEPDSTRGCPQPGMPGRDFPATEWQSSDDLYAHVHPEEWYISAWCATEAVAQSFGADGWRVSSWSDSDGVAVMVKTGLHDDSVSAVEYEARLVRTDRGWYVNPEQATARYWCGRGVDVSDPSQCV
jgi:hypothetical protein